MLNRSTFFVWASAFAILAAGCGTESAPSGTAGTSGGTAGTSGGTAGTSGGTAGTSGGTAGTSGGTAGTNGGTAGTTGGTAGTTGGTAGTTGGTAGTTGGTAGTTGGTAGTGGGNAGTAGDQGGRGGSTAGSGGRGGGAGGGRGGTTGTGGTTGSGGGGNFTITSPMLAEGADFPASATCEATGTRSLLPELHWDGVPAGTMSFALAFIDKTILDGMPTASTGHHSIMWDIPAGVRSLPMGLPAGSPPTGIAELVGSKQKNPLANQYLGPCPNHTAEDIYNFELYALPTATAAGVNQSDSVVQIRTKIRALNPLGVAILSGHSNAMGTLK